MDSRRNLNNYFIETFYNEDIDLDIMDKLWDVLFELCHFGTQYMSNEVCFISLYGSQNYGLANKDSDIDCECFVFPSAENIIFHKSMISTTITTKYGTCVIKDIRAMFDELRKSSPNILECIATNYTIVNRDYQKIITDMCNKVDDYATLSEYKLLRGLEGLYRRYAKDCNGNCKYYANFLRICEMINSILHDQEWYYHSLLVPKELEYLRWVKNNKDFKAVFREDFFNDLCFNMDEQLKHYFDTHEYTYVAYIYERINYVQKELFNRYIKLNF